MTIPILPLSPSDLQRFWSKVNIGDPNECWEWQAGKQHSGYGNFSLRGQGVRAHRVSWALANGPIPKGRLILHRCDNPPCVNPNHLFDGSQADNMHDMSNKGRSPCGEKSAVTDFTEEEIYSIRCRYARGETQRELAEEFRVAQSTIGRIVRFEVWEDVGGPKVSASTRITRRGAAGETNGRAVVSEKQANLIRHLYATGEFTQQELGNRFGISRQAVGAIVRKETWI